MTKKSWIYTSGGLVAAVAMLAWAFAPRPVDVEVATVTKGHFESTIDEDGKTRLRERYVVSAPLTGLLTRITLREGDVVDANATVATLTPVLSPMLDERTLRDQQMRVQIAQAQVQRVEARIEGAKVALQQAQNEVQRSELLAKQSFVSQTKLDADRLAVLAAKKALDASHEERHIAGHELEQARAALMAVSRPERLGQRSFVLHSPVAGRVLRVLQASEAAVTIGTPLLELGNTHDLEVVAELLTADALQTKPGSAVVIERWGGAGYLQGRVRLIEPAAFTKVSALGVEEQRVKVLITLTSSFEQWQALGEGFRVGVRIVTLAVDQALKVPVSAVFPLPSGGGAPAAGGMAVFALKEGRAVLTSVQLGGRNGVEVWVKNGLAAGDTVIVYPSSAVKDGQRVKVRKV
ncbi:MAG: HlyD family efflux transporter periplasmic adaptor subunit [Aquabacterium sp.]|nr:HlyD family efflux transporter periplasmic adaptor subunit [Aquabacterium sp.]